jgi:hypothetical protein
MPVMFPSYFFYADVFYYRNVKVSNNTTAWKDYSENAFQGLYARLLEMNVPIYKGGKRDMLLV